MKTPKKTADKAAIRARKKARKEAGVDSAERVRLAYQRAERARHLAAARELAKEADQAYLDSQVRTKRIKAVLAKVNERLRALRVSN